MGPSAGRMASMGLPAELLNVTNRSRTDARIYTKLWYTPIVLKVLTAKSLSHLPPGDIVAMSGLCFKDPVSGYNRILNESLLLGFINPSRNIVSCVRNIWYFASEPIKGSS